MEPLENIAPLNAETIRYTWVASVDDFRDMLGRVAPFSRLAIDIEADSLYHYFEKVCLIQISTDAETFIIDPLIVDVHGLGPCMANPSIEKVFHAASYDISCLRRDYEFQFASIFDTHLAAQLIGYEFLGLSPLMDKLLGISHSKQRQRDDWSRRPLESEQLEYAAMDTHHLLRLRDVLEMQLRKKERLEWAHEEFEAMTTSELPEKEFDPEGFFLIKGSRELSLPELAVLKALFELRDIYARELDVPPFKIMNNSVLLDLARRPPNAQKDLFRRSGISYRVARKFGVQIVRAIEKACEYGTTGLELPARHNWKPPSKAAKMRLNRLRQWRESKSKELELNVGVVFPGNMLEALSASPPGDMASFAQIPGMRRWRLRHFGEEILALLHE